MLNIDSLERYDSEKIKSFDEIVNIISDLKSKGKKVGLCHGGFDLLHPGHVTHFESAKKLCDVLVVSVTSDKFVASRKGDGRPIFTDKLRAFMIASLGCVDFVVVTDFKLGVDVINSLSPSYYIKGPDFINKATPGITSERNAIKEVFGEMKYTNDPKLGTTEIIEYIKNSVKDDKILLLIDRDGTLIKNNDFLGKNKSWKEEIELNDEVINLISYIQTKHKTTKIVVTNQAAVARGLFDTKRVEEINNYLNDKLKEKGIKIDSWQYCPDVDTKYAESKKDEFKFHAHHIKEKTKRKPNIDMALDGLKELNKGLKDFTSIIVLGDRHEDKELADNLKAKFIDVKDKNYDEMLKEAGKII